MKIATWNVNSVKARIGNLVDWLKLDEPDVVCLQEIKTVDEAFPAQPIEDLGYNLAIHGQKTYNGVAILSRYPFDEVNRRLPGDDSDEQARYVEVVVVPDDTPVRIASIYLPNGNPVDSEKYPYKLGWMDRLKTLASERLLDEEAFVIAGDYNVIPTDDDVHDPAAWADDALFLPETRASFRELENFGFTDAFRACSGEAGAYTFWDYQGGAWQKNNGIRIDHLMLSPQAADRLVRCEISPQVRAWERPSDHVPVWIELDA